MNRSAHDRLRREGPHLNQVLNQLMLALSFGTIVAILLAY
jgi:hypothetical protein